MALDIVFIKFEEDFTQLVYDGKTYSPEEFPLKVPIRDYQYVINDERKINEAEKIIFNLDDSFNRLKGGGCYNV